MTNYSSAFCAGVLLVYTEIRFAVYASCLYAASTAGRSALPTIFMSSRVHLVCPVNGACSIVALLLCELLDAGCISDFSCLASPRKPHLPDDVHRLFAELAPSAHNAADVWALWWNRSLVVKNTISSEAGATLARMAVTRPADTQLHDLIGRRDRPRGTSRRRRRVASSARARIAVAAAAPSNSPPPPPPTALVEASPAAQWLPPLASLSQFFTHQILFIRDPIQQYLSARAKPWCSNCGGFTQKFRAQEAMFSACWARRSSTASAAFAPSKAPRATLITSATPDTSCPFHAVIFDRDLSDLVPGGQSAAAALLHRRDPSAGTGLRLHAILRTLGLPNNLPRTSAHIGSTATPGVTAAASKLQGTLQGTLQAGTLHWDHDLELVANLSARRERNVALGMGEQGKSLWGPRGARGRNLLSLGNTRPRYRTSSRKRRGSSGHWYAALEPKLASRRRRWDCTVATRVRQLVPTIYDLYHPLHCQGPWVRNATDGGAKNGTATAYCW